MVNQPRQEIWEAALVTGIDAEFDAHADPQLRLAGELTTLTRIGMRCTTLTQLPLVFSAGSGGSSTPMPG